MLQLYYKFFYEFCENDKYEEMEMDTDSLYLALAETNLYNCIKEDKKEVWEFLRSEDCNDDFAADSCCNFFPRTCCEKHKKHDKREPGLFKEEFRCTEMLCLCSKTYCCYDAKSNKYKFSSKGLNKRTFEDSGDGPMAKYQKVLTEKEKKKMLPVPTEASARKTTALLHTSRQRRVCLISTPRELLNKMVFILYL